MNWNTLSGLERLHLWKELRNNLTELPFNQHLEEVAKFCGPIPFGARSIDYYNPEEWITPWEILFYGSFCTSSISLLIFDTLVLLSLREPIELFLVEDSDGIFLLPIIDNQFVLNYELGRVNNLCDIEDNFTILKKYQKNQIRKII